jgi:ABC-type transport system involved in multi-copper enzyme maturation, permease component
MFRLFRTEVSKQVRRPRTWVALGFVTIVPIIIAIAVKASPPTLEAGRGGGPGGGGGRVFLVAATQSGLFMPVAALRVMSQFFLVVVICLFAGDAIASEAGWGNLRFLLTRPIARGRLLAAKLGVAALFGFTATALVAISGLLAGGLAFGFKAVSFPQVGVSQSVGSMLGHLALSVVLITWGLSGVAAFGFMISTMTDSSAGAIFGAVGLFIVTSILGAIDSLGSIRFGMPAYYLDSWSDLFRTGKFTDDMWRSVLLQVPYVLVFVGVAYWWFRRKDITS